MLRRLCLAMPFAVLSVCANAEVSLSLAGDTMLGSYLSGASSPDRRVLNSGASFLGADIRFVNLEGPIGGPVSEGKSCAGKMNCHKFSQIRGTESVLAELGINAASVANNHALDTGLQGRAETLDRLRSVGIVPVGGDDVPVLRTASGVLVAMLGFSTNSGLPDWRRSEAIEAIRYAKKVANVVFVSVHAGCEGEDRDFVYDGDEMCFGENRGNVVAFARNAISAGADIIVGHGPHVPRGFDIVSGRLVLWSLGNFMTAQGISVSGKAGLSSVAKVVLNDDGVLKWWSVDSYVQDRSYGLSSDAGNRSRGMVFRKMPSS